MRQLPMITSVYCSSRTRTDGYVELHDATFYNMFTYRTRLAPVQKMSLQILTLCYERNRMLALCLPFARNNSEILGISYSTATMYNLTMYCIRRVLLLYFLDLVT